MFDIIICAIAYNVWLVCDAAPSPTRARGRCGDEARRSAEEPEPPRRGGDAHTSRYAKYPGQLPTTVVTSSIERPGSDIRARPPPNRCSRLTKATGFVDCVI